MTILLAAFLIGVLSGLRALTPAAVVAWAAHAGALSLGSGLAWMGSTAAMVVLVVLAIGELIGDKLPSTPNRTAPLGLGARIVMGALTGACLASAGGGVALVGAGLGAIGGIAGAFAGYRARMDIRRASGLPDVVVAVLEDLVTIAGALWVVS
jgi:uncharacterized membrane protein